MKKKIAIFQSDLKIGGIQKSLINLLNNLDKKKYEVDLYIFESGDFKIFIPEWINVIKLNKGLGLKKYRHFNTVNKHNNIKVLDKEYDLSIDYNGYDSYCSLGALKVNSKKKVIWIHNDLFQKYDSEWKYRVLYKYGKNKFKLLGIIPNFKSIYAACIQNNKVTTICMRKIILKSI